MKKGFTLVELLVVIGIMGLLGTVSVAGYRQMRRGMEIMGVRRDVNALISAAYQRAQIDRQPTAVFFWNETLRGENEVEGENMIVVGHAAAVRRAGRITEVQNGGSDLVDEFADLERSYQPAAANGASQATRSDMYLYPMDNLSELVQDDAVSRTLVETRVYGQKSTPVSAIDSTESRNFVVLPPTSVDEQPDYNPENGEVYIYAFRKSSQDRGAVTWRAGMAYGMEFAHAVLPHGYFFGKQYKAHTDDPLQPIATLVFDVGKNDGGGKPTDGVVGSRKVVISTFRLGNDGRLEPHDVAESQDPTERKK